jgi:arylsulfatase A-like enzyme
MVEGRIVETVTWGLTDDEYALPMAFNANDHLGYSTAAIGKWHLADARNGWLDHPNRVGFGHFSGLIIGEPHSYFAWNKTVDGKTSGVTGYAPTDKVDDAIEWIDEQGDTPVVSLVRVQSAAHSIPLAATR